MEKRYELLMEIYKITKTFPKEEKYGLSSQLRNSSNSVSANIAESHGSYYFADKTSVLYASRGESEETRSRLIAAFGFEYINNNMFNYPGEEYEGLSKGISSYIPSLKKNSLTNSLSN